MQQKIALKLLPSEASSESVVRQYIAGAAGVLIERITGYRTLKKSIDARSRQPYVKLTVLAFFDEPFSSSEEIEFKFNNVTNAKHSVIIVGGGPAGLFAALKLIELGIRPVILERGKDVRERRRDLAVLNKEGIINPESNYCFGEGGAGTYSDGKLYTRSNKRGDIDRILNLFVHFGAEEKILYESHPHIGTNKLPHIITAMRQKILECGGEFLFHQKVVDLVLEDDKIKSVKTADGAGFSADAIILATGHSARDVFHLLDRKEVLIEAKPFALGVRVEHPQSIIDHIQYRTSSDIDEGLLPPASYSLVQQVEGKGVFSFCMCPGGIIAPASTSAGELVVNGWSPSKRNNPFANSGIVVSVDDQELNNSKEYLEYTKESYIGSASLRYMHFQQMIEQKAFAAGGGHFVAPAQRMTDFCNSKISSSLPVCSYLPGVSSSDLKTVLPAFIYNRLVDGFRAFGKKMKGYYSNDAIIVATESRTSSPVRIPRDNHSLQHPQVSNLYPCGEGAGYAGGIVSAAMDGERVAERICLSIRK